MFIILIFAILVATGGLIIRDQSTQDGDAKTQSNVNSSNVEPITIEKNNNQVEASSKYSEYTPEKLANLTTEKTVLFFKADWCPTCKILDKDIQQNIDSIPENVTILTADYDTEKDLKKQYRVATQHTLVVLDNQGNQIQTWSGILTLNSLLETI